MQQILRPYQERTRLAVREAWAAGKKFVCVVAPTGAGKTVIAESLLETNEHPLAVVHTRVLREQTAKRIPGTRVCTIQSLLPDTAKAESRRDLARRAKMVFGDEIHHWAGEDWRLARDVVAGAQCFGATATPQRADGTPLGDICDHLVVAAHYSELLADGNLCPCDIDKPAMTRKQMKRAKIKPDPVKAYLARGKRDDGSFRPGILFAPTIAKCEEHVRDLTSAGVRAALVTCNTDETERQAIFDAYARGELDLLASPMALAEGFDAARAEVCVLSRMAQHLGTYLQMCGRVLRPYGPRQIADAVARWGTQLDPAALVPKERALLIDCSDAASIHGNPTDDRRYSLSGRGIENKDEPEPKDDDEPTEPGIVDEAELIEMEFSRLRQTLADNITELQERAKERGYRDAWVYHRIRERFGIELPRVYPSKYRSTCVVCRHRVELGQNIYWLPPESQGGKGIVKHLDCYIASLPRDVLELVRVAQ
jgi:DNA repair protein RadD